MPSFTYTLDIDTWLLKDVNTGHPNDKKLFIRNDATNQRKYTYLYFPVPAWGPNPVVISAKLYVFLSPDNGGANRWGGTTNLTMRRIDAGWEEGVNVWANRPTVAGASSAKQVIAGVIDALTELDVAAQLIEAASGSPFYGIRLETDRDLDQAIRSGESTRPEIRPYVVIEWQDAPAAPFDLIPTGGKVVGKNKPILVYQFEDPIGGAQVSYQAQIDNAADFVTVVDDSGVVASAAHQHDMATRAFALVEGTNYWWRVQATNESGQTSPYSLGAQFVYKQKGTVAFTGGSVGLQTSTHAAPAIVASPTPGIRTTFTVVGQSGTPKEFEAIIYEADEGPNGVMLDTYHEVHRSGVIPDTDLVNVFNVPNGVMDRLGWNYRVEIHVWDTLDRVATPGDPTYSTTPVANGYIRNNGDGTVGKVTALAVADRIDPSVDITWTYVPGAEGAAVFFVLDVDDKVIEAEIVPADVLVAGSNYKLTYHGLVPGRAQDVVIHVTTGVDPESYKTSTGEVPVAKTPNPKGVWLTRMGGQGLAVVENGANAERVQLVGPSEPDMDLAESSDFYQLSGRRDPVKNTDTVRGYEGTIEGMLTNQLPDGDAQLMTAEEMVKRLERWRGLTQDEWMLTFSRYAFRVRFGSIAIRPRIMRNRTLFSVGIVYKQSGDFTFEVQ